MKEMGMEKIIFNKDNILTDPKFHYAWISEEIHESFYDAIDDFGEHNVAVVSNIKDDPYKFHEW